MRFMKIGADVIPPAGNVSAGNRSRFAGTGRTDDRLRLSEYISPYLYETIRGLQKLSLYTTMNIS